RPAAGLLRHLTHHAALGAAQFRLRVPLRHLHLAAAAVADQRHAHARSPGGNPSLIIRAPGRRGKPARRPRPRSSLRVSKRSRRPKTETSDPTGTAAELTGALVYM